MRKTTHTNITKGAEVMKKTILAIGLCLTMFCSVACENKLMEQAGKIFGTSQEQEETSAPTSVLLDHVYKAVPF